VAASFGIQWVTNGANGPVTRGITVLTNQINVFAVLAYEESGHGNKFQADAIEFGFTTLVVPSMGVRHFMANGNAVESAAARFGFRKIVEYVKNSTSTSQGFDPTTDTIIQSYYLWNQTWSAFAFSRYTSAAGVDTASICTHTADGVATICAWVVASADTVTQNGTTVQFNVHPNAFSHTLTIKNFPFKSTQSQLALKSHLDVRVGVADLATTNPAAVTAGQAGLDLGDNMDPIGRPTLGWATTVDVTGNGCAATYPVVRTVVYDAEVAADVDVQYPGTTPALDVTLVLVRKFVYHSFLTTCPTPTSIFWDPDFGVITSQFSGAIMIVPSILFLCALLFALL